MKLPIVFLLASAVLAGCSRSEKNIRPESRSFNDQEINEGQIIHDQILSSFYTYTDSGATSYIHSIGYRLLGEEAKASGPYNFTILYNDKLYATSAPGGYIYITTGLINFLDNEAELAAVIAHEIGSLQFQDPRVSKGRRFMDQLTQGVAIASPALGQFGALAVLGAVVVNSMVEGQDVDEQEKLFKSDEMALHYMVEAGYDPQGYVDLFRKVVEADRSVVPYLYDYYQTHPITTERFTHLSEAFSRLPLTNKTLTVNREQFAAATKGIKEIYRSSN